MFCPSCQTEFPRGFLRCDHCDRALVDVSPQGLGRDRPSDGNLLLLWSGDDLARHEILLEELKKAGIPYFNRAIGTYSHRDFPNRFPAVGMSPFGYEVSVLSSDWKTAKAILETLENGS